jgi:hypothetical protein
LINHHGPGPKPGSRSEQARVKRHRLFYQNAERQQPEALSAHREP